MQLKVEQAQVVGARDEKPQLYSHDRIMPQECLTIFCMIRVKLALVTEACFIRIKGPHPVVSPRVPKI